MQKQGMEEDAFRLHKIIIKIVIEVMHMTHALYESIQFLKTNIHMVPKGIWTFKL